MEDHSGSAFPTDDANEGQPPNIQGGLTKREWFAGMASDETVRSAAQGFMDKYKVKTCSQAEARFFYADEMIEQSKK